MLKAALPTAVIFGKSIVENAHPLKAVVPTPPLKFGAEKVTNLVQSAKALSLILAPVALVKYALVKDVHL